MKRTFPVLLALISLFTLTVNAKEVPPPPGTLVTDYAGLLSPQERQALENKLVAYDDSTSTQIAVVLDNSLEGDDLFDYTLRIVEAWGIGRKGKDNGVLLYVALQDRKIIIQTGYGVEGFLTDAMSKRIIESILKPAFREEQYYAGLDRATDVIIQLGSGEYTNEGGRRPQGGGGISLSTIIILIIIIMVLISLSGRSGGGDGGFGGGGRYNSGRRGGGWIFFPGGGWGGGGGGDWGGGGGFGGFGGGGFGGGGAMGDW